MLMLNITETKMINRRKITKSALAMRNKDTEWVEGTLIKDARDDGDNWWELATDYGDICCEKVGIIPKKGMKVKFYGKGLGYTVRGLDINGHNIYYRTPKQAEKDHEKWCRELDKKNKNDFKKHKKVLDNDYKSLPEFFQKRIDKFRKNNHNFRWEYESYEMFCCMEAVKISRALKTPKDIKDWSKLSWEEQIKKVDIDEGHSGNTLSCSTALAYLYLSEHPEGIVNLPGALAPLVGSKKYGCVPSDC